MAHSSPKKDHVLLRAWMLLAALVVAVAAALLLIKGVSQLGMPTAPLVKVREIPAKPKAKESAQDNPRTEVAARSNGAARAIPEPSARCVVGGQVLGGDDDELILVRVANGGLDEHVAIVGPDGRFSLQVSDAKEAIDLEAVQALSADEGRSLYVPVSPPTTVTCGDRDALIQLWPPTSMRFVVVALESGEPIGADIRGVINKHLFTQGIPIDISSVGGPGFYEVLARFEPRWQNQGDAGFVISSRGYLSCRVRVSDVGVSPPLSVALPREALHKIVVADEANGPISGATVEVRLAGYDEDHGLLAQSARRSAEECAFFPAGIDKQQSNSVGVAHVYAALHAASFLTVRCDGYGAYSEEINPTASGEVYRVVLRKEGRVEVFVVDEYGNGVAGVRVYLEFPRSEEILGDRTCKTDSDGHSTFEGLGSGQYRLYVDQEHPECRADFLLSAGESKEIVISSH